MSFREVIRSLGTITKFYGALFVLPTLVALIYGEYNPAIVFVSVGIFAFLMGKILETVGPELEEIHIREGFMIVALSWLVAALLGSFPFYFTHVMPNFYDAFFEAMSGITTTGATVVTDLDGIPRSILFWRGLIQWIGGMGIIVLSIAVLPELTIVGRHLFRAEVPGVATEKIVPRIRNTAIILWSVYAFFSIGEVLLLKIAGMSIYDAICHTFTTMATGGFSTKLQSIGYYNSPTIEFIICTFMFIAGTNFALHYHGIRGNFRAYLRDSEFRFYLAIIIISVSLVSLNLYLNHIYNPSTAFRYSLFQVMSILTTTGYTTADFNNWTDFSKMILLLLMFIGGCAGSTGGSIKNIRIFLLLKLIHREVRKLVHPSAVLPLRIGDDVISDEVIINVGAFFFLYMIIFIISTLFVASHGYDIVTSISAVAATQGNVGPGLGLVGPSFNYAFFSPQVKLLLATCMWIGRLELFTVILLLFPSTWRA